MMKISRGIYRVLFIPLLLNIVFLFLLHPCSVSNATEIPGPLQPWVDWVLHDNEHQLQCIPQYNDPKEIQCNWPTRLVVDLKDDGGTFQQDWQIHYDSWIVLPGNSDQWPLDVKVDGKSAVVIEKNHRPSIKLESGSYFVTGSFEWGKLPEYLQIPNQSALVSLSVNDKTIEFPNIDSSGKLWVKTQYKDEKIENRLNIESFRLIDDKIPTMMEIYVSLDVAGSAREIILGPIYSPDNFIPVSLQSTLPARLEDDAKIRVQVRPGRHSFTLTMRHINKAEIISFKHPDDGLWPEQEIWSFNARPNLRIVEIEGVTSIDPQQTSMPRNWLNYPAYRVIPGDSIGFNEIKRGDPTPAPDQLTLDRTLWLRFDGSGYTIQDSIKGEKHSDWRLEMNPDIELGRVAVDGSEQFITRQQDTNKSGVELRKGLVDVTSDSHMQGSISTLSATGWDHDFQEVRGRLNLPPGWRLINAGGIDNIPYTWVKRWTLLDFFIVLIFTVSLMRLFSKPLAVIAFFTLLLTYHEPNAPRYVWLALLIGFALLKHLPESKFKRAVKVYQLLTFLVLLVIVVPYSIQDIRVGIYPQLAEPWTSMADYSRQRMSPASVQVEQTTEMARQRKVSKVARVGKGLLTSMSSPEASDSLLYDKSRVLQYDPKSVTQTGPGLPEWKPFETIGFSWSGPVSRDQTVSFTLIGPRVNMALSFVRVLLVTLLALGICGIGYRSGSGFSFPKCKSFLFSIFLVFFCFSSVDIVEANDIPSQEMLNILQERLLEKDECFPSCANISEVNIAITPENLSLSAKVDALIDTAIPLPSHIKYWLPQQVSLDENRAKGLYRVDDGLWVMVPAGKHILRLEGSIRERNTIQLPFLLKPHRLSITASAWAVEGVHPDGTFDSQIQFKRIAEQNTRKSEILDTGILPSFALVERNILLGLDWKVETRVQRISPRGAAIVLDIPLLPGESVTTEGIRVDNGAAKINLKAEQDYVIWESFLDPTDSILLTHLQTDAWTEIWKVDVSPIYHLETEGIPVILHKSGNKWYPTWHPWPGEELTLNISRPVGVEGQTMTIEKSHLELWPGSRTTTNRLTLTVNSSQGGQHVIEVPSDAELQEVKIDGIIQPIRQDGREIPLPITPGKQQIELKWRDTQGISTRFTTPVIDLGMQSVNASVDLHLPDNRWPLLVGGEQLTGPAVLFWSVILIIVLMAFGLSRTGLTPLKFHHWVLLGIGLSMSNFAACFLVLGWLIAIDLRKRAVNLENGTFNLMQLGIGILTLFALSALVFAISQGLLGHPDMNIVGNGSRANLLRWYQDVSDNSLPQAWVYSIPMFVYRVTMLAWALWISFGLVNIIKWGWGRFTEPTLWHSSAPKAKKNRKGTHSSGDEKQ